MHAQSFSGIQSLRFVAAFMVLVTHATFYVGSRMDPSFPLWNTGAQGVQLFFVISGFVMYYTAAPLAGRPGASRFFMLSRLVRIAPLYWSLNLLKIVQILAVPALAFANPTVSNVVLSLLFIPSRNAQGGMETFYGVGWTLNFEMAFYLLFGMALWVKLPIIGTLAPILIVGAVLSALRTDSWPAVTYLFHPIVLNFLWGILLARWTMQGGRLSVKLAILMIAVGSGVIFLAPDAFVLELEYAMVVAGVISLEPWIRTRVPEWLTFGGDASYSLYLVHPMVGVFTVIALKSLGFQSALASILIVIAVCLAASAMVYALFERPITSALRKRFLRRPSSGVVGERTISATRPGT
jgi:exopolysaccharide production protein ExoZ